MTENLYLFLFISVLKISSQTQKELALNLIKQQFEIHTNQELGIPHINNDTLIASKEYLALDEFKAIDLASKRIPIRYRTV